MATKLKNLVITKVALVDEGACSAAHIKLYKRKEGGNKIMGIEDILKLIPEDQREAAKAAIEKAKTDNATAEVTKAIDSFGAVVTKSIAGVLAKPEEKLTFSTEDNIVKTKVDASLQNIATALTTKEGEIQKLRNPEGKSEEELLKSLDPAVRTIVEKANMQAAAAQAAVLKLKEDADNKEAIAKAKELTHLSAKEADVTSLYKSLKKVDSVLCDKVHSILKAADAMLADGNITGTIGSNGTEGAASSSTSDEDLAKAANKAWADIQAKAEEIAKSAHITKEAAVSKAITENPDLYKAYVNNLK